MSFTEFALILVVALVVLGPQRLPVVLRDIGRWINKLRRMTTEMRAQTGIDDLLRNEGIHGGLSELRALLRGDPRSLLAPHPAEPSSPYGDPYAYVAPQIDAARERPEEGPDSYSAIAEDLLEPEPLPAAERQATSEQEQAAPNATTDVAKDPLS